MPAVSKDQQRAAGIALQAKREGKVDELPAGAAKEMAKSMTEKELVKMASVKLKGVPLKKKDKKNEARSWAGVSLSQVFTEEKLELVVNAEKNRNEKIATQKSKVERLKDEHEDNSKSLEDSWTSYAGGKAPAIANSARGPMTANTMGARVAEQNESGYGPARWDEYEHDYDELSTFSRKEIDEQSLDKFEEEIIQRTLDVLGSLEPDERSEVGSKLEIQDYVWDVLNDWVQDNGGKYSDTVEIIWDAYDDDVLAPEDVHDQVWYDRVQEAIAKKLAEDVWRKMGKNMNESISITRWKKLAGILAEKDDKKWMQKATDPEKKGVLSRKLGIPEDKNIPMGLLLKKKRELQRKAEGDKKLTKDERETLDQIIFAINAKRAANRRKKVKKENRSFEEVLSDLDFLD